MNTLEAIKKGQEMELERNNAILFLSSQRSGLTIQLADIRFEIKHGNLSDLGTNQAMEISIIKDIETIKYLLELLSKTL